MYQSNWVAHHVVNLEPVASARFTFDNVDCVAVFVENVVAVKPKKYLFE